MAARGKRNKERQQTDAAWTLLRAKAVEAATVLANIMYDEEIKPEVRIRAAESILDRVCGKVSPEISEAPADVLRFEGVLDEWSR